MDTHAPIAAISSPGRRRRSEAASEDGDPGRTGRRYRRTMRFGQMHTLVEPPDVREIEESLESWLGRPA